MLDKLTSWLSPAGRANIYATLSSLGAFLALLGIIRQDVLTSALGLTNAALGVLGLLLASWHARRLDMVALYSVAAVTVAALQTAGLLSDGTATRVTTIVAAITQVLGLALARHRTDPKTPTGEPAAEYFARP